MIKFGRDVCGDLASAERREWLVTNGIGGYASGTVAGFLTRRYHGLLIAALQPPVGRVLLVSKLDTTAHYAGREYPLYINRWTGGMVEPDGYRQLERFYLEGTTPVWHYSCADALLEKRIWMRPGANATYVHYHLRRATAPLKLTVRALVNYRNYHHETHADNWEMKIKPVPNGLRIVAREGSVPFYLLSDRAQAAPYHDWYTRFFLMREANRGLNAVEDHLHAGDFEVTLEAGESVTFVASAQSTTHLDGATAYAARREHEEQLLAQNRHLCVGTPDTKVMQQLVLATDQFIVKRPLPTAPDGRSIIAGYHWFSDWGRDSMIALPGLTLTTRRHHIAAKILRTYAHFIDQGMLPNRFPDASETPEYNTVDATLWYFEAIRAYHAATGDDHLVQELFPALQDIIAWHQRGTRYQIHADPGDGLLYAGERGQQLTWMDAKVGDWVITPRTGKPVEVNALWFNALRCMVSFAHLLGEDGRKYRQMADKAQTGFGRFWNEEKGYCYDVLDGPQGDDDTLRPNQILAVSLPHTPLEPAQQKAVVDKCSRHLLTSHGLRTLSPDDAGYIGSYGGDLSQRDSSYHQGTVWGWLIGPFIHAHLRVYQDKELARSFLKPLFDHLADHGVGSISEIFDGDPPFTPRGCIAQAWSVAELLRACAATFPEEED